jgi:replication factor C small subunit
MNSIQKKLFEERYRPCNIQEICLPERLKKAFHLMIEKKEIPNLLLYGYTGIGKTTMAKILVDNTESEYLFINGSKDRGIDILKTDITDFVTTVSLNNLPKVVIIDEADNLSIQTLAAMRGFIEEHTNNARFIFTAESIDKFPKAILGRLQNIEFRFDNKENAEIKSQFYKRILWILEQEKINIDNEKKEILKQFLKMYFPGLRKIIVELQKYLLINGVIDIDLLKSKSEDIFIELVSYLKSKNFYNVRQLIKNSINEDSIYYMKMLYDRLDEIFIDSSIPDAVIIIGEYMYRDNTHRSKEINFAACCMQLIKNLKFK